MITNNLIAKLINQKRKNQKKNLFFYNPVPEKSKYPSKDITYNKSEYY